MTIHLYKIFTKYRSETELGCWITDFLIRTTSATQPTRGQPLLRSTQKLKKLICRHPADLKLYPTFKLWRCDNLGWQGVCDGQQKFPTLEKTGGTKSPRSYSFLQIGIHLVYKHCYDHLYLWRLWLMSSLSSTYPTNISILNTCEHSSSWCQSHIWKTEGYFLARHTLNMWLISPYNYQPSSTPA